VGAALRTPADVFGFFAEQTPSTTTKEKDKETRKRDFVDDGTDVRSGIIVGNQGRRAILSTPFPRRMIEFWRLVGATFLSSSTGTDAHLAPVFENGFAAGCAAGNAALAFAEGCTADGVWPHSGPCGAFLGTLPRPTSRRFLCCSCV
jgi:hypothetical protein